MDTVRYLGIVLIAAACAGCASPRQRLDEVFQSQAIRITPRPAPGADGKPAPEPEGPADERLKEVNLADMIVKGEKDIDEAMRTFRTNCAVLGDTRCKLNRNAIQDRLIAASNTICRQYKSSLKQAHANTNLFYGGASTILGGLGALSTAANPAKLFAGAASISSGLRAETNQSIYAMLAVEVITKAMDKTRVDRLREIDENHGKDISRYSLERAIADAMSYHEGCSLLAGLQEASVAVSQSESVGLRALSRTMDDLGQTIQVPLGRKSYRIDGKDAIFIVAVCAERKAQYESFVQTNKIIPAAADYAAAADYWNKLFVSAAYCKDYDKTDGPPATMDKKWTELVTGFPALTDEQQKQLTLAQIEAQQASAKAISAALDKSLNKTQEDLLAVRRQYEQAEDAIADVKAARASIGSLQESETDAKKLANERVALRRVVRQVEKAVDRIKSAKGLVPASAVLTPVATAFQAARAINENSTDAEAVKASNALSAALIAAGW